jgi:hypothetical protein
MLPIRVAMIPVDPSIPSSYGKAGGTDKSIASAALKPLIALAAGQLVPMAAAALLRLVEQVRLAGGELRITDAYRSVETQAKARARYDRWHQAGRPAPGSVGWDAASMKADFVALPGRSFHNAGRAIDVHVRALSFPGVDANKQLDELWKIAIPLGWTPIIRTPNEAESESWHFDFLGDWKPVVERRGYEEAAIGAVLETGQNDAFPACGSIRRIQSQLHRAGYDVGGIDGMMGAKTEGGLYASGYRGLYSDIPKIISYVDSLISSDFVRWSAGARR